MTRMNPVLMEMTFQSMLYLILTKLGLKLAYWEKSVFCTMQPMVTSNRESH